MVFKCGVARGLALECIAGLGDTQFLTMVWWWGVIGEANVRSITA